MHWIFMQTMQQVFNFTDIQVSYIFIDKIWKLLQHHTPFYHQLLQSYLKNSLFFGPPCIHCVWQNKIPDIFRYNSSTHHSILIIVGRNFSHKVGDWKLYEKHCCQKCYNLTTCIWVTAKMLGICFMRHSVLQWTVQCVVMYLQSWRWCWQR